MNIYIKSSFAQEKKDYLKKNVAEGKIFFYPTDTVYGLGCDAANVESVKKINDIKRREKPLSIIAPSKEWIRKNCDVEEEYLQLLPGKITLIVKTKKKGFLKEVGKEGLLGVRIPKHWFSEVVEEIGKPFVTTSANFTGEKPFRNVKKAKELIEKVDVVIDEGILSSKPSKIINTITKEVIR